MTELDEALRALEKDIRQRAAEHKADCRLIAGDEAERCADELAALLTTRQEVAPVATVVGYDSWHRIAVDWHKLDMEPGTKLYTSTGQTSREVAPVADSELPGMWSASDFTGGDPDERCHAERAQVAFRGYAKLGIGAYLIEHSAESEPAALMLCIASDEEKAGRTVGDLKTFEGEREPIPAEKMTVRIDFASVAGLDALEQQLRILREVHFPTSTCQTSDARDGE